ncbi:MAG: alpha-ketoacid dehydrogenase subunit beta [FCB group bacterium]|nr:alpha-ketoacid dehydrogenase subunit beta [FCB group bacterium]
MSSNKRDPKLNYALAINEALYQKLEQDDRVLLMGQGVKSPWYVGQTAKDLIETFGETRIIDTPVSENAMTGAAVGAAISGMRPVVVHPRMDFMLYAFDPIINQAANWYYMSGGMVNAPVVIWGVINRGGEQGAQHSQALHALFAHIPGLKVVMPATPYDAKGLMVAAIEDENPVIFIDDRQLYGIEADVPQELFSVEIGKAAVRREGKDVSLIGVSYMAHLAEKAADILTEEGIEVEVVDLRTVKPLDVDAIVNSVKKTGRAVIADPGWAFGGLAAEVSAVITENAFAELKTHPVRVTLADVPAPAARTLEKEYYPDVSDLVDTVRKVMQ